jgi:hypothetical protein
VADDSTVTPLSMKFLLRPLRWALIPSLIACGLFFLNGATANYWLAGGPPNPHASFNKSWGDTFLTIAALSFGFAFLLGWLPRHWNNPAVRRHVSRVTLVGYFLLLVFQGKSAFHWQTFTVGLLLAVLGGAAVIVGPLAYRVLGSLGAAFGIVVSLAALLRLNR